ncbi:MAG: TolC family protein, partial [Gemmatimonadota bacterium]|nr:TolC family protein [Gemmatimonadota bacterium]
MRTKSSFTGSETLMALTLLISLAALFCTRGTAFASSPEVSSLLSSPVPFYHDYNLAAMFPVGTGAGEKEGEPGAGGAISLDRCIDIALGMNPGFQKSHQNVRATTGDILAAWGEYMPTLSTSFGISQSNRTYSYVDPSGKIRVGGGISKSSYTSLNLNYTLFDRAAKYFRMKN